jgi:hypothetical protein
MFKNLLANMGLGQSDLVHVFEETLVRLDREDITTPELRRGRAQAVLAMMNILRDEDVMANVTYQGLTKKLIEWQSK